MKYMKYLWMSACALLLATVTACSDYEIFAKDLNPAKVTDDDSGDSEEEDNWDGTFEEGAVLPFTRTNRAVTASFTNVFFSADVKAIERQGVLVSWRWLPDDADDITFDVYRNGIKLNETPISKSTNYKDLTAEIGQNYTYEVKSSDKSLGTCKITPTDGAAGFYRSIKVKTRVDYDINDGAIGDLDGDGEYEIVIKRQVIGQARDVGDTKPWTGLQKGTCLLEAYKLDGTVESLQNYGAFVDLGDGLSGLVHISQISLKRIKSPADVLNVGDEVTVKIIGIKDGKISLSMKALEEEKKEEEEIHVEIPKAEEIGTSLGDLFKGLKLD